VDSAQGAAASLGILVSYSPSPQPNRRIAENPN